MPYVECIFPDVSCRNEAVKKLKERGVSPEKIRWSNTNEGFGDKFPDIEVVCDSLEEADKIESYLKNMDTETYEVVTAIA